MLLYLFHEFLHMYITGVLDSVSVARLVSHGRCVQSNPTRVHMYMLVIKRFLVVYTRAFW